MTLSPRTLTLSAAAVLVVASVSSWALVGTDFAGGVAATGALMLVNLLLWTVTVKGLFTATLTGRAPVLPVLVYSLKLLVLAVGLLLFSVTFPPVSVVLGASVVVAAILVNALVSGLSPQPVGEA